MWSSFLKFSVNLNNFEFRTKEKLGFYKKKEKVILKDLSVRILGITRHNNLYTKFTGKPVNLNWK